MGNAAKSIPTTPRRLSSVAQWDFETDIAVIGFGGAGACAAIEAADAGAEVALFELASGGGGSTAMSSGELYLGGNGGTPIQRDCGFEDSTEDMVNYLMKSFGVRANEAKIRAYCDSSTEHYRWLVDKGVPFKNSFHKKRAIVPMSDDSLLYSGNENSWPYSELSTPCPRGHAPTVKGDNGGPVLFKNLADQVAQRDIQVHYETRVLTLIADDDNHVHGVVIRMNQKEYTVRAHKGVILCNGGFCMNTAMVKKYAPKLARGNYPVGNPGDTGSGILMGMGVGGASINMDEGFISMPFYPPEETTFGIFVNAQGQRFVTEDGYHSRVAHNVLQQQEGRIYLILHASEDFAPPPLLNADIAGTGETIEELEDELKLPAGMLKHTVEFYNQHAAQGEDPLFHKAAEWLVPIDPPYVALDCTPGRGVIIPYFTFGGLETLPSGEVLNHNGDIIQGLYAAGRTACGVPRSGEGYSSGTSVGDATFSGRMAGIAAAGRKP
jgi:succinate dehydrogenase/fumarate reductase flavoprotein subunit